MLTMRLKFHNIPRCSNVPGMAQETMKNSYHDRSDLHDPEFLVNRHTRQIEEANEAALTECSAFNPLGRQYDQLIHIVQRGSVTKPAYFNGEWFEITETLAESSAGDLICIRLKRRQSVPDDNTLEALKRMIAVLIHRLRSPLTGMQGYLDLMKDETSSNTENRRVGLLGGGIDQLFTILDELETLHRIPTVHDESGDLPKSSPDTMSVVQDVLSAYPAKDQKRIHIRKPHRHKSFNCNRTTLKSVLSRLIQNALDHTRETGEKVFINIESENAINVSHSGTPIEPDITKHLFFPFVTSKANGLGIGLTMALMHARQVRGSVFLTDNNLDDGISFTFCVPPADPSSC